MFILFYVALYTANLIHLILAIFFLVFLLTLMKQVTVINYGIVKKVSFLEKYWIILVLFVDFIVAFRFYNFLFFFLLKFYNFIILLFRYIWALSTDFYVENSLISAIIQFFGMQYRYKFFFIVSFTKIGKKINKNFINVFI